MRRIYEPNAYSDTVVRDSYWRTTLEDANAPYKAVKGDVSCDVAVIGAGFTGLSAALHIAPEADVVVLDAETPGWGASGRNGGFVCIGGSKASDATLIKRYGFDAFLDFYRAEQAAIDLVRDLLDRHAIDADTHSDGETILAHHPKAMEGLRKDAAFLRDRLGAKTELIERDALAERGFTGTGFYGAMQNPDGFAVNPLKYVLGLAQAVLQKGGRIFGNSPVTDVLADGAGGHILRTSSGSVRAKKLIVATNGYSSEDVPNWFAGRYMPVQSNVIVTREMTQAEISDQGWTSSQMAYDTRHLLHYFRLMPNRRFLFGMRGGTRADAATQDRMRRDIRRDFDAMFPAWRHVETPHFWSGLACLSRSLTPYVGPVGDLENAYTAIAYHGNGVAMGSYCGALLADIALSRPPRNLFPEIMKAPLQRFPMGPWRRALLPPAYSWYGLQDRW